MRSDSGIPAHIAIVMDGNGRWALQRNRPRSMGHKAGLKALRSVIEHCANLGVRELTVFAFSSENWSRPEQEVSRLMDLFMRALDREAKELNENNVCIRFIGHVGAFSSALQHKIHLAQAQTAGNTRMTLNVAINYGGRWDIVQATRKLAEDCSRGLINPEDINEELLAKQISLNESRDPDLLIRTGGEMRISNFLLWQFAYTELHFTPTLWPDFGPECLDQAIAVYRSRERRFGLTSEQVRKSIRSPHQPASDRTD
ncbi:MAG: isoprenyl transferase [Xanthomonadales bacterium]